MSKFRTGDLVKVSDTMPRSMSHFPSGGLAIVLEVKEPQGLWMYSLLLRGTSFCAWYGEAQLTMVRRNNAWDGLP